MILKDFLLEAKQDYYEIIANKILCNYPNLHPTEIDLYDLCNTFGIKIQEKAPITQAISSRNSRKGLILLESVHSTKKERELIAEEFAHIYLHQCNQLSLSNAETNKIENQAFKLASNILIPSKYLLEIEVYPAYNQKFIIAEDVADQFNVTTEFAYKRLKYLKENYRFYVGTQPLFTYTLGRNTLCEMPPERIVVVMNKKHSFILG